jgi:hypothetical protein
VETNDGQLREAEARRVSMGRHQSQCRICAHADHEQIEQEWINWGNTSLIAERYGVSRDGIYRHAHALGLFGKRRRNVVMAAEKMIERVDTTPISSSAILSAIKVLAKINSAEQEVAPVRGTDLKQLLERMTQDERLSFARDGSLPAWFSEALDTTLGDAQEGENASRVNEDTGLQ